MWRDERLPQPESKIANTNENAVQEQHWNLEEDSEVFNINKHYKEETETRVL